MTVVYFAEMENKNTVSYLPVTPLGRKTYFVPGVMYQTELY